MITKEVRITVGEAIVGAIEKLKDGTDVLSRTDDARALGMIKALSGLGQVLDSLDKKLDDWAKADNPGEAPE